VILVDGESRVKMGTVMRWLMGAA